MLAALENLQSAAPNHKYFAIFNFSIYEFVIGIYERQPPDIVTSYFSDCNLQLARIKFKQAGQGQVGSIINIINRKIGNL